MTIGERLKILREARHESLEDVSKVLGVTRQARFDEIRLVQNQSQIRYISTSTTVFVSLLKHRYFAI